jgi:serine/threonine protein kinase
VLHQIGNGALGPVFRAYDQDRDRLVAVKLFRLDLPPERVHQLVAEFEKLIETDLQHPVIASPRATGIDGNSAYLAQDFAAAESLDIVLRENGAAPPAQAARVAGQLAEALDYAADRTIVHGALHPRDILLSQDDLRIVGLGVARALERAGVTAPVRRPYAPPERINDSGWDRSADVFSLAAIVFEMLCARRVTGTGSDAADALTEVPGADMEALQRVFALALAADPSYRYGTASAFTDALKDAMGIEAAAPKPKARRRPRLRVVEPHQLLALSEGDGPLEEVPEVPQVPEEVPEVQEVQKVPEVHEVPDEPEIPPPDPDPSYDEEPPSPAPRGVDGERSRTATPEAESPVARKPRRRRAPAPTPVAIETIATPQPEPELVLEPEPIFEAIEEPVIQLADAPPAVSEVEPVFEPEPEAIHVVAFEPLLPELEPPVSSLEDFSSPDALTVSDVEPRVPSPEVFASREPRAPSPEVFASPEPRAPSPEFRASIREPRVAAVWPIGVAAIIGIAVGFGVGYTMAIRDRVVAPAATARTAAPQPAAKEFTEVAAPAPTPVVEPKVIPIPVAKEHVAQKPSAKPTVSPKPAAKAERAKPGATPKAGVTAGTLVIESRPAGASVLVDGQPAGTTPLRLSDVKAGKHAVRLERDGYRIWTAGVNVPAGESSRVTASLEK